MSESGATARLMILTLLTLVIPLFLVSLPGQSQSVKALKADDEEMRRTMVVISRQLGVECTTCHNTKNFLSAEKVPYRVAKEHMRITQALIDNGFDGKDKRPKADCYMCHRGQMHPRYKEPFDPMTMEKEKIKIPTSEEPESESTGKPSR